MAASAAATDAGDDERKIKAETQDEYELRAWDVIRGILGKIGTEADVKKYGTHPASKDSGYCVQYYVYAEHCALEIRMEQARKKIYFCYRRDWGEEIIDLIFYEENLELAMQAIIPAMQLLRPKDRDGEE